MPWFPLAFFPTQIVEQLFEVLRHIMICLTRDSLKFQLQGLYYFGRVCIAQDPHVGDY